MAQDSKFTVVLKCLVKYMKIVPKSVFSLGRSKKAQKNFNVVLQLLLLWIAGLFGYYTALSYYVSAEALDQAVLTNQISLAIFCQSMVSSLRKLGLCLTNAWQGTINSSACAQVIESTNVSSLATQVFGNSSLTSWTDATVIPTSPNGFAVFNMVIFLLLYILSSFGLMMLAADLITVSKESRPHSSQSPHLAPSRRTSTVELESNGHEPAQPGDRPPEGTNLRTHLDYSYTQTHCSGCIKAHPSHVQVYQGKVVLIKATKVWLRSMFD
jgi:hypothetical protein